MLATITCLLVPALALVVLSALIVTSRREFRSFGLGMFGVMGIIFGGPGAALLVGASGPETTSENGLNEPIAADQIPAAASESATRPSWIDEMPTREGEVHTQVVSSDPHVRIQDAYKALDAQLKEETDAYIRWYLASDTAPQIIDLDVRYIKQRLRNPQLEYTEIREYSVGPMRTTYARLDFDEQFRNEMDERWQNEVSRNRLLITALAGGGVFLLLLTVFAYFRLDTATRGYYTGRLQFLTIAAILALVAAGVMAVRWVGFQWLA